MLTPLLREVRIWPALLRRRLQWYRLVDWREHVPFVAMAGLPVLFVGAIICFAYFHGTVIDPERLQASQRQTTLAHRRENDLQCLAENIYFEARAEPLKGQYAVAEVTVNRTQAPNFPHTICGVVHEVRWDPARKRSVADFSWTELGDLSL